MIFPRLQLLTTPLILVLIAGGSAISGVDTFHRVRQSSGDTELGRTSSQAQRSSATTDGLSCSVFEWISADMSEKAAMLVPISLNGKRYWYQLDTGADVVVPYGSTDKKGWSPRGDAVRIPDVRFAGMHFSSILGYPMKGTSDPPQEHNPHGTVGLEPLIGRAFVIDFPKRRICLMERADLPESLTRAADWAGAEIRHGKLFVDLDLNGKKLDNILYDTGSSPDELDVDLDLWQESTGRTGTKDATTHSSAQSWGREEEFIGALASGDLKIGNHVYRNPMMTTEPAHPDTLRTQYWARGLLGNALFTESIIILDLGAHPRFGIISKRSR